MDGQATSLFPTIENNFDINEYLNTSEKKEQYKYMQQEALEFIQKENPDFFRNFQESMYSQNPIIIKKALINGAETLIPFLSDELKDKGLNYNITLNNPEEFDKLKKEFKDEYAKYQNNNLRAKEQVCGVFALAALVVVVAAAVLYIVVVSEVAFWSAQFQDVANERSLLPEELTLEIATHLY
jgi:SdpC family antimicrobial peptide